MHASNTLSYLWLQSLDAVVGHEEDPEGPQPLEGSGAHHRQLVPAQVQQPGATGDAWGDPVQPAGPAVHQVGGLIAQAGVGARLEALSRAQEKREQRQQAVQHPEFYLTALLAPARGIYYPLLSYFPTEQRMQIPGEHVSMGRY